MRLKLGVGYRLPGSYLLPHADAGPWRRRCSRPQHDRRPTTSATDSPGGTPLRFVDRVAVHRVALAAAPRRSPRSWTPCRAPSGGFPPLADTGVPFIFIDKAGCQTALKCGVSNGVTYYYSVTAFDVNSPGHGPTSLESAKITKQVVPGSSRRATSTTPATVSSWRLRPQGPPDRQRRADDRSPPANSASSSRRRTR